jgi:4,5-dihydroxyphthalate decarboxylase
MSARLRLTIACDDFEIVRPLKEGRVSAEGIDLVFIDGMTNPERHSMMVRQFAFDICELNVSTYLIGIEKGLALTAIPIFLFRKFRHGNLFVSTASGITKPQELNGARIGCPNIQAASNIWLRGILADDYGVTLRDSVWVIEHGEEIDFDFPLWLKVEHAPKGTSVEKLMLEGEIPAVMSPLVPKSIVNRDPCVRRLFADYRAEEAAYFERHGIFPVMHVTAIKRVIVDEYPWVVRSLERAFETSKQLAYNRLGNVRVIPQAWFGAAWEEERALLGTDPWAYGWTGANRATIDTAIRYTSELGLISKSIAIEQAFVTATEALHA